MKDRVKGKIEEVKGRITGDPVEEAKGKARQKIGDVKQTAKELEYDAEHRDDGRPGEEAPPEREPRVAPPDER